MNLYCDYQIFIHITLNLIFHDKETYKGQENKVHIEAFGALSRRMQTKEDV